MVDNANVVFVLADADDNVLLTKTTAAYSIERAGNILTVHLNPGDPVSYAQMYYTVTILTRLGATYTMEGELSIEPVSSVFRIFGLFPPPGVQLLGMPQSEVRLVGMPEEQQRSGFGTLTIKKPRVFGRRSPDTQLVGTIQEQERSGLGILTTTNPRMLGTQPKTNVRLFGMLQEIDKN